MNRIDKKFKELRRKKQKAFIAFVTAGDPDLKTTEELILAFEKKGVDIIEIGVPFSDPLADGPTIQAASQRALEHHVSLEKIFHLAERIRRRSEVPLALMTYFNPVYHFGEERFLTRVRNSGIDGLIVPDLPPEEARELMRAARKNKISLVFFLSPTTTLLRLKKIVQASTGFIYYVSVTGVTGQRRSLPSSVLRDVRKAKRFTSKPICVGFGVSTPQQVESVARAADGVIVGSAIIKEIEKTPKKSMVKNTSRFVGRLVRALKK